MKIAIFGGTSEGRALGTELAARGAEVHMFVATGYGEEVIPPTSGLTVTAGRLDADEMARALKMARCAVVVDATHPYATEVTQNIRAACMQTGMEVLRLVRAESAESNVHPVPTPAHAIDLLNQHAGNILLTVGSKELAAFTAVHGYRERVFARVLPSAEVVSKCVELGLHGRNLLCMQGPFTHEMNVATIRMFDIQTLVTKDSGSAGGFREKQSAAAETGTELLVIGRPTHEEGFSLPELLAHLEQHYQLAPPARLSFSRFPLFISLAGKPVLVVGGGSIAARRVEVLRASGAEVTVLSPALCPQLQQLSTQIRWKPQPYCQLDRPYTLVVAATNDRAVNRLVGEHATARGIPVSVADSKTESTFWFPAIAQTEALIAGIISQNGDHSAVRKAAAVMRQTLEGLR